MILIVGGPRKLVSGAVFIDRNRVDRNACLRVRIRSNLSPPCHKQFQTPSSVQHPSALRANAICRRSFRSAPFSSFNHDIPLRCDGIRRHDQTGLVACNAGPCAASRFIGQTPQHPAWLVCHNQRGLNHHPTGCAQIARIPGRKTLKQFIDFVPR